MKAKKVFHLSKDLETKYETIQAIEKYCNSPILNTTKPYLAFLISFILTVY